MTVYKTHMAEIKIDEKISNIKVASKNTNLLTLSAAYVVASKREHLVTRLPQLLF